MEQYKTNKENSSESRDTNFENVSDDPSRVMERKEKREYLKHNKTQFKFFSQESKRLREEIENTEDSAEIESLRKELDYASFRRAQESLFEDYLSDDFDEELFIDQLEEVRKKELKYLQKKFSGKNESGDISKFYNIIAKKISSPSGIDENDLEFRKTINPLVDKIAKEKEHFDHMHMEDLIIGAKKYNKDAYLDKFKTDLDLSKDISIVTKENEEFMSVFDGHISGGGTDVDSHTWNEFQEKFGDTFVEDLSLLDEKGASHLPWIAHAEDQFSGETAKGWLSSESFLYSDLVMGTNNTELNNVAILKDRLREFNKKYNFDTLNRIEDKVSMANSKNEQVDLDLFSFEKEIEGKDSDYIWGELRKNSKEIESIKDSKIEIFRKEAGLLLLKKKYLALKNSEADLVEDIGENPDYYKNREATEIFPIRKDELKYLASKYQYERDFGNDGFANLKVHIIGTLDYLGDLDFSKDTDYERKFNEEKDKLKKKGYSDKDILSVVEEFEYLNKDKYLTDKSLEYGMK